MIERRAGLRRLHAAFGLSLLLVATAGPQVFAQGHTPDPYNIVGDYNSQYLPFMYATEPTDDGVIPNQSRLQPRAGNRAANRFDSYIDSLDGAQPESDSASGMRRPGIGVPYYRANRRFDQDFKRVYRPNENADRSYYEGQRQRDDLYFDAMRRSDPRKRSQMLREYNMENLRAARGLSTSRNAPGREPSGLSNPNDPLMDTEPETEQPLLPRRSSSITPPSARRNPGAPSTVPGLRTRPGAAPGREAARSLTRPGAAALPFGSGLGSDANSSSARDRSSSDVLDRATRATAPRPTSPRTTAPPPR